MKLFYICPLFDISITSFNEFLLTSVLFGTLFTSINHLVCLQSFSYNYHLCSHRLAILFFSKTIYSSNAFISSLCWKLFIYIICIVYCVFNFSSIVLISYTLFFESIHFIVVLIGLCKYCSSIMLLLAKDSLLSYFFSFFVHLCSFFSIFNIEEVH